MCDVCIDDGARVVIEATGKPAVYPLAVQLACRGGRVVALGSPRGTVEMDFMRDVHLREVELIGAFQPMTPEQDHVYYPWTKDRDRQLLLVLMAQGKLTARDLVTHRYAPEQCQAAYQTLAARPGEALGAIFEWCGISDWTQALMRTGSGKAGTCAVFGSILAAFCPTLKKRRTF